MSGKPPEIRSNDDIIEIRATMLRRRRRFRDRRLQFSLRGLLAFITVVALLLGLAISLRARLRVNVEASDAPWYWKLPRESANVSYYEAEVFGPWNAIEFTVSEEEFLDWAARRGWSLSEIGARGYRIHRYTFCTAADDGSEYADIQEGYCYSWGEEDRGVYVVYDRIARRAYYFSHTR